MKFKHEALYIALSVMISYFSWANPVYPWLIALTLFIPALWVNAQSRWSAFLIYYVYLLVASSGLFEGIKTYFDSSYLYSLMIWSLAPALGALPVLIVWSKNQIYRVMLVPVVLTLLALPPSSLAGWSHPLVSTGWIFPNGGWLGLLAALMAMMMISYIRNRKCMAAIITIISFLAFIQRNDTPSIPSNAVGIDTYSNYSNSAHAVRDYMKEAMYNFQLQDRALAQPQRLVVYPETVAGRWNSALSRSWTRAIKNSDKMVLFGAIANHENRGFENVIALSNSDGTNIVYRQRYPIPVGMWNPLDQDNSTHAYWFDGQATVEVGTLKTGIFLCYESLLIYPTLQTLFQSPDMLIVASSLWWSPNSIKQAQSNTMKSWSRLFSIPLLEAYNL